MRCDYNPLLPEHQRDPYPGYAALRAHDPAHWSELLRGWVLTRHADVSRAFRDPRFSVDRKGSPLVRGAPLPPVREELRELAHALERNMLLVDPPEHSRLRALVTKAFTLPVAERHRQRIQEIADELLDTGARDGEIAWVRDFAAPLPLIVIAELFGIPGDVREEFRGWAHDLGELLDPFVSPEAFERGQKSAAEMFRCFRELFAERRREPRGDLLSALLAAEESGDVLSELELFSNCVLILGAGHRTTCNAIGNAVWALLQHPEERQRLQENPHLLTSAVDEFLRYEAPVQTTARVARADVPHHGGVIREGDFVLLLIGAANRDPAEFPEPDRLCLDRSPNRHLAFGGGIHACLGSHLAHIEIEVAIGTLLRRHPHFRAACEEPAWQPSVISRGLDELPLRLSPGR